jgi:maltoporin
LPAAGQQPDLVRQQIEELKQEYETTTQAMQLRIATLEQQVENQKQTSEKNKEATISAADLAAEHAARAILGSSNQVGGKYQGQLPSEPTYDLLREATTRIGNLEKEEGTFEFHGYFRSGYALNSEGGQQVAFQAPGGRRQVPPGERGRNIRRIHLCQQLGKSQPEFGLRLV